MFRPNILALAFAAAVTPAMASAASDWIDLSLQFKVTDVKDDQGNPLAPFVFAVDIGLRGSTRVGEHTGEYSWEETRFGTVRTSATPITQEIAQSYGGYAQLLAAVPATSSGYLSSLFYRFPAPGYEGAQTDDELSLGTVSRQKPNPAGGYSQYGRSVYGMSQLDGRLLHEPTLEGIHERLTSFIGAPGFRYTEFYSEDAIAPGSSIPQEIAYKLVRGDATLVSVSVVPEPASVTMLLAGLAAVGVAARRQAKRSAVPA